MIEHSIAKSLNKVYRQIPVDWTVFDNFKEQLHVLYEQISSINTEEKLKGDFMDFLKQSNKLSNLGFQTTCCWSFICLWLLLHESVVKASHHVTMDMKNFANIVEHGTLWSCRYSKFP